MHFVRTIGAAISIGLALGGAAVAQPATAINAREVMGNWTLAITPAQRRGLSISVESSDGGRPDLTLEVSPRAGGGIICVVGGDPAECSVASNKLVITSVRSGASMTFSLTERVRGGFTGTARVKARLLPFGSTHIGTVSMTRR